MTSSRYSTLLYFLRLHKLLLVPILLVTLFISAFESFRVAAYVDNTYAQFTAAAEEIAFSSGPVTNESTDIVFKTQINNQQETGSYNSTAVYIVVPVF